MSIKTRSITAAFALISCVVTISAQQDFTFTTATGQPAALSSLRGKVTVLLFSGSQDPQRRDGVKALESLADRYQGKDVKIYWVSVNPPAEMTNEQLKSPGGGATSIGVLRDAGGAALKRISGKSAQLPTIVVLDREGNLVGQPRGGFNPNSDFINDLASTIDRVLGRS